MVVMTSAAMIDSIPPAPMRAPLKQAKLANKARMIRQPRQAAREYGQAFKIDHALRLRAAEVLETKPAPCASNPFARVIVADNGADTVLPAQRRVFLRRRLRIELARRAAHHVDHVGVAFLVTDRDGVGVRATTACVGEGAIDHAIDRRQFERPAMIDRGVNQLVIEERTAVAAE